MPLIQLVWTSQGYMVGDYFSTSFVGGKASPVFSIGGTRPTISTYDQAIFTTTTPLDATGPTVTAAADVPEPDAKSDHEEDKTDKKQR